MKQSFILIIGIIVAIVLIVTVFVMPMYDDVKLIRGYIEEKKIIASGLQTLVTKIDEWNVLLTEEKDVIERVDLSLPEDKDVSSLIVVLENLSGSSGITLDAINIQDQASNERRSLPNDNVVQKKINSLDLSMELSGSYSAFKLFIGKLENNIRSFDVKSISFDEGDTQTGSGVFGFTISGSVYYQ